MARGWPRWPTAIPFFLQWRLAEGDEEFTALQVTMWGQEACFGQALSDLRARGVVVAHGVAA